jgi:DNA-binding XRE family transcriptional regulator
LHKLEQIRNKLNISKTEMARRLEISKSNYSMIIHGQHGVSKRVSIFSENVT